MSYVPRFIEASIKRALDRNKSVLLLGPRQTGKTTILRGLATGLYLSLSRPKTRIRYEKNPALLTDEVEALVKTGPTRRKRPVIVLDEVQKVPALLDGVQDLIEDCLIGERIEPLTRSATRKKLIKSSRWLFFDMGVRRIAVVEGTRLTPERKGHLFEHFIGLELLRCSRLAVEPTRLRFWRDADGPEVDWVFERGNELVPIEVKWTDSPTRAQTRHIQLFLSEYPEANRAYVVCRSPRRLKLADGIDAIPWQDVDDLVLE